MPPGTHTKRKEQAVPCSDTDMPLHHWHQRDTLHTHGTKGIPINHQGKNRVNQQRGATYNPRSMSFLCQPTSCLLPYEETIVMITHTNSTNVTTGQVWCQIIPDTLSALDDVNALEYGK